MKRSLVIAMMLSAASASTSASLVKKDNNGNCYVPEQPEYALVDTYVGFPNTPYCRLNLSPISMQGYPSHVKITIDTSSTPHIMNGTLVIKKSVINFTCTSDAEPVYKNTSLTNDLTHKGQFPSYCYVVD